jgi:serine phosphatase RsbU (regulator of sigma subunit)/pSer/pThr/pTyr-binding forkhead associated (FHA) protein
MPWLKILKGETPGRTFPLTSEVTVLGRERACDIVLADQRVSKRHAKITRKADGYYIEDLHSTNGTIVGDRELTEARRLEGDELICVGDTQLVFSEESSTVLGVLDVTSTDDGQIVQLRPQEKLRAILEIARDLGGTIDLDGVLGRVLEALFLIIPQAGRACILLEGDQTDELILRASRSRDQDAGAPAVSRSIFKHVTSEGRALLCEDVGADNRFGDSPSARESRIRMMMCVPLWNRERRPIGVIQVDTQDEHGRFDEDDLELMVAIAAPVSVAIENARLHEIAVKQADFEREARDARAVQFALIPQKVPELAGYRFWHAYEPARSVGGDYFDYRPYLQFGTPFDQPALRWAITIGDVSGKGMAAAILMARFSSEVGLQLQFEPDPCRVVDQLNRNLCASRTEERFITFLLAVLDGEHHELTVVNAGQTAPLIRRFDGRIEVVGKRESGLPLGIVEERDYEPVKTSLNPGDVVVLHTDGVNEAMDNGGDLFGLENLMQTLANAPAEVVKVGESILDAVRRHAAGCPQSDDITLLCFGRTGADS